MLRAKVKTLAKAELFLIDESRLAEVAQLSTALRKF
jgi:hypothetical protein